MNNWTKLICGAAVLTLGFSIVASAQPDERGRNGPGSDLRQRAADLPEQAEEAGEAGAEAVRGASERGRQGLERRMEAFERQMAQFEEVNARRMAQLERLRELAVENDREDVLERVDHLIERETERFTRQIGRLRDRMAGIREETGDEDVPEEEEEPDEPDTEDVDPEAAHPEG